MASGHSITQFTSLSWHVRCNRQQIYGNDENNVKLNVGFVKYDEKLRLKYFLTVSIKFIKQFQGSVCLYTCSH